MAVLQTHELVKSYTRRGPIVVNRVSLEVETGEIVGLLGPNGAGKSTTFYMVVGLIRPIQGRLSMMMKTSHFCRCINVHDGVSVISPKRPLSFGS